MKLQFAAALAALAFAGAAFAQPPAGGGAPSPEMRAARQAVMESCAADMKTLCDGKDPASKCQTVTSQAATLKLLPAIVRPGVDAVALYEEAGLKARRVVYSCASDQPPPHR